MNKLTGFILKSIERNVPALNTNVIINECSQLSIARLVAAPDKDRYCCVFQEGQLKLRPISQIFWCPVGFIGKKEVYAGDAVYINDNITLTKLPDTYTEEKFEKLQQNFLVSLYPPLTKEEEKKEQEFWVNIYADPSSPSCVATQKCESEAVAKSEATSCSLKLLTTVKVSIPLLAQARTIVDQIEKTLEPEPSLISVLFPKKSSETEERYVNIYPGKSKVKTLYSHPSKEIADAAQSPGRLGTIKLTYDDNNSFTVEKV